MLEAFPKNSPGRLLCYCDDCQSYLHHLKRADLLDENGGTEVIPVYPADIKILSGKEHLKCTRLSSKGMFRFSTTCCNTPVGNAQPNMPWFGIHRCMCTAKGPDKIDKTLGPIRASIMGRFAKGTPPAGTPKKFSLGGFLIVVPFIIKGKILKKSNSSPFFVEGGKTPIVNPHVLSQDELQLARASAGV